MSQKFRHHKIGFQNMFYTKCNNIIIDNIGILISLMVDIDYRFINLFCVTSSIIMRNLKMVTFLLNI